MSIYICEKCGAIENTALGGYWLNKLKNSGEYEYYVKLKNASVSCAEGKNSDKESIVHRFYDKCSEEM